LKAYNWKRKTCWLLSDIAKHILGAQTDKKTKARVRQLSLKLSVPKQRETFEGEKKKEFCLQNKVSWFWVQLVVIYDLEPFGILPDGSLQEGGFAWNLRMEVRSPKKMKEVVLQTVRDVYDLSLEIMLMEDVLLELESSEKDLQQKKRNAWSRLVKASENLKGYASL